MQRKPRWPGAAAHGVALAGGRAVAQAVRRGAQVGAALGDPPVLLVQLAHPCGGSCRGCAAAGDVLGRRRGVDVGERSSVHRRDRPLPDVAGDVVQAEAVGRELAHRRRCRCEPCGLEVLPGEPAVPGVRHHLAARGEVVAPGEGRARPAHPGGVLPLRLVGQGLAGPLRRRPRRPRTRRARPGAGRARPGCCRALGCRQSAPGTHGPPAGPVVQAAPGRWWRRTPASRGRELLGRRRRSRPGPARSSATVTCPVAATNRRNSALVTGWSSTHMGPTSASWTGPSSG